MTSDANTTDTPSPWRHPLLLVIALGAIIRLYHLGHFSFWYDEAASIIGAAWVDRDLSFLSASESRLIPMFAVLGRIWYELGQHVFGITMGTRTSDAYLRLLPLASSVALIPMTYVLSMYLFKQRGAALIAALFIAISPFQVYYAQEYRPHSLYALVVCAGIYCSLRALEDGTRRWWIATVITGALAIYTYYFSALYLVCMNLYALTCFNRYRDKIRPWTISQLSILALIIPPALMASQIWGVHASAEEHWFPHPTLKTALLTLKNFFAGYSSTIPLYWTLFFVGLLILLFGLYTARNDRRQLSLLLCVSIVPILIQIIVWSTQEFAFYTYRVQLAFAAPVYILMGVGVAALPKAWARIAVAGIFTLLSGFALKDLYQQNMHPVWNHVIGARYKVDSRSASDWIASDWQEGDRVAHFCTFSIGPFLSYYLPDKPQWVMSLTEEDRLELLKSFPDEAMWTDVGFMPLPAEEIIDGAARIWYVESWWDFGQRIERMDEFREWLDAHCTIEEHREYDGIEVVLYVMDENAPD